jgi:hypothetical protein
LKLYYFYCPCRAELHAQGHFLVHAQITRIQDINVQAIIAVKGYIYAGFIEAKHFFMMKGTGQFTGKTAFTSLRVD